MRLCVCVCARGWTKRDRERSGLHNPPQAVTQTEQKMQLLEEFPQEYKNRGRAYSLLDCFPCRNDKRMLVWCKDLMTKCKYNEERLLFFPPCFVTCQKKKHVCPSSGIHWLFVLSPLFSLLLLYKIWCLLACCPLEKLLGFFSPPSFFLFHR